MRVRGRVSQRLRDFLIVKLWTRVNQSLFGGKNAIAVVILERLFAKMGVVAKTSFQHVSILIFDQERTRLPPVKITVQNLLLTKGKKRDCRRTRSRTRPRI